MQLKKYVSGVLVVALIAIAADVIQRLPFAPFTLASGAHPIESMAIGLIVGIILANTFYLPVTLRPGFKFCMGSLLSLGIILLGFKLNIETLFKMPIAVPIIIVIASLVALFSAVIIGRFLKNDKTTSLLIGLGNAICGSSAIMAASASIKDVNKDQIAMSITIVNLLGLLIIFILPAMAHFLRLSNLQAGLWAGATGQAVPQAIAAGFTFSEAAGVYATIIKLSRVLQLGPYVIAMKIFNRKSNVDGVTVGKVKKIFEYIPLFIVVFIAVVLINSHVKAPVIHLFNTHFYPFKMLGIASEFFLTMALTAIGLQTNLKMLIKYGGKNVCVGLVSTFCAVAFVLIAGVLFLT